MCSRCFYVLFVNYTGGECRYHRIWRHFIVSAGRMRSLSHIVQSRGSEYALVVPLVTIRLFGIWCDGASERAICMPQLVMLAKDAGLRVRLNAHVLKRNSHIRTRFINVSLTFKWAGYSQSIFECAPRNSVARTP